MRYFTRDLWLGAQRDETGDNDKQWSRAAKLYYAQLAKLRSRLGPETFEFFNSVSVHDGELMSLRVTDGSRPVPLNEPPRLRSTQRSHPVTVGLVVLDACDRLLWTLSYHSVRRLKVDFPGDEPLFYSDGEGFSDLGYHELTNARGGFLRHEVLFSTGATILVECKEVKAAHAERNASNA